MSIKRNILRFSFVSILGVLLHFTYAWSHENRLVAMFSAVNESTWEHLKLLFFPMLLLTIIEILFFNKALPDDFLCARLKGIIAGMLFIVFLFYTIWGVFGKPYDFINIALYFAGVIYALRYENRQYGQSISCYTSAAAILLVIICAAFFIFTIYPPSIGLFAEPV